MASQWTLSLLLLLLSTPPVAATPSIALPFNAQVPAVARVGTAYSFQFSDSTFYPAEQNTFTYSLSGQPSWLLLDSATRMLSGSPSSADVGASTFTLTATDDEGAAHMECTLVVSSNPPPQLEGDVASQVARTANLSSLEPPVVTLLPLAPFKFRFRRSSFIDIVQRRKLQYYATLADHTPLPGWLLFDSTDLTFEGVAPQLSAFPQSWAIELIASDVEGFAGAGAKFEVAIGRRQLVFVPQEQIVSVTVREEVQFEGLKNTLFLDGAKVAMSAVASAKAESMPEWLSLDAETLAISGTAPHDVKRTNITVTVTDAFGNKATAVVALEVEESDSQSLFKGDVGTLTAKAGEDFAYHFSDDLFASEDVEAQVLLPATAKWLRFDAGTRTLSGRVPENTAESTVEATITVKLVDSATSETQEFSIEIQPAEAIVSRTTSASSSSSSSASTASTTATTPELANSREQASDRCSPGAIVGVVVGAVGALAILAALLFVCCRRRRRRSRDGYVETDAPSRRTISRPILPPDSDAILVTKEVETDIEKNAGAAMPEPEVEQRPQEPATAADSAGLVHTPDEPKNEVEQTLLPYQPGFVYRKWRRCDQSGQQYP